MNEKDLLTKEEIAREMSDGEPLSIRSVERYIQLAEVRPAIEGKGRGRQAKYARADVEKIKEAYRRAAEARAEQTTALTTTKPAALAPVALVGEIVASNAEGFQSLRAALDVWPVWMPKVEALERTGLPVSIFDAGVKKGELTAIGKGRATRFHRDDLRAFAERVRDAAYLEGLLSESPSDVT